MPAGANENRQVPAASPDVAEPDAQTGVPPAPARLFVRGMFCSNCETRVEEALAALPGITDVHASFRQGLVTFRRELQSEDGTPATDAEIRRAIADAGYEAKDSGAYLTAVSVLIIILAIYVIANHLGWLNMFNLFPRVETGLELGTLFIIGLLTGVHCIAMCGGINLTQSTLAARGGRGLFASNLAYNGGRVISYTLIGGLVGALGSVISLSGTGRGIVAVIAGVAMIIMALSMLGVFLPLRRLNLHLPGGLYARASSRLRGHSSLVLGLLNGLMPCGPLQAMQVYALTTGSAWLGALSMFLFSLGTTPLMLGFGLVAGKLNRTHARWMLTVSAFLIFIMGLNMASNGLALSGVSLIPQQAGEIQMAEQDDGTQTITTEIDYGSYPSLIVRSGVPVQWTILVPDGVLNGCNGEIVVPAYDLDIVLHEGENVVTFLPGAPGTIPYSCWMGMITASIHIVE